MNTALFTTLSQDQMLVGSALLAILLIALILLLIAVRHNRRLQQQVDAQAAVLAEQQEVQAAAREREGRITERATMLEANHAALSEQLEIARDDNADLKGQLRSLEATQRERQQAAEEKIALLMDARKQLETEFQNLANKIFEERARVFSSDSQKRLDATLTPLREQLGQFRKKVEDIYDAENRDRGELKRQLTELKSINTRIGQDAENLTRALKGDSKLRGNWGEMVLERVLEESGLSNGREFLTQQSFTTADGKRRQPDVIIKLPGNKCIVVDAKVSLVDYERYCSADTEAEQRAALTSHIASLRNHVRGLSSKDYEAIDELHSLDFVLAFVPIEAAFTTAFEHDPNLFREAYERHVVITSPTTLLASLRTVESIWRYERQDRNAALIAEEAGKLHDQFVLVTESLAEVGRHLDMGRVAWEKTLDRLKNGRGNMVRRVQKLEKLGARVKKSLPASLTDEDTPAALGFDTDADTNTDTDSNSHSESDKETT